MRGRTAAALLVAVVVGWLAVPQVVSAVGSIVTIQGGGGTTKAGVTKGNQLQVAETAPANFHMYTQATSDTNCHVLATIPGNKGFVMRSAMIGVTDTSNGGFPILLVWPNGYCAGTEILSAPTLDTGTHSVDLDPGFAIVPGGHISFLAAGTSTAAVIYVYGYLVPKGDVPATTHVN